MWFFSCLIRRGKGWRRSLWKGPGCWTTEGGCGEYLELALDWDMSAPPSSGKGRERWRVNISILQRVEQKLFPCFWSNRQSPHTAAREQVTDFTFLDSAFKYKVEGGCKLLAKIFKVVLQWNGWTLFSFHPPSILKYGIGIPRFNWLFSVTSVKLWYDHVSPKQQETVTKLWNMTT